MPDPARRPASTPRWLTVFCLAGLVLAGASCDDDGDDGGEARPAPPAAPRGELATLSFEAVAYVEPSANNIAVLDRVRDETHSALSALGRRHITVSQKKQVDVDLKRLVREPVSVIDPATKTARPAVRLRYRFIGLGFVPKEMAARGDVLLGVLQRNDPARASEVLDKCVAPADRVGEAVHAPWRAFDPSLEACSLAIEAEQRSIDEARKGLEHPEREIVPIEHDRLYLPVLLHLHTKKSAASPDDPGGPAAQPGGSAQAAGTAQLGGTPVGDDPVPRGSADLDEGDPAARSLRREQRMLDKLKKEQTAKERDDDEAAAEEEEVNLRRRAAAEGFIGGNGGPGPDMSGAHSAAEVKPHNYTLLWFTLAAMVILFGTELRRRLRRGQQRPPQRPKRRGR